MQKHIRFLFELSDRLVRLPDGTNATMRARSRALVIWTTLAIPSASLLTLLTQDFNFAAPITLSIMAGCIGMACSFILLRQTQNIQLASLVFVASVFAGLTVGTWFSAELSIVPSILLGATPVYFGLILNWRWCLKYTIGLCIYDVLAIIWHMNAGTMQSEILIPLIACALAALGCGLSTVAYSQSTERASQKLKRQKDEISELALLDPLTGIFNRRAFDQHASKLRSTSTPVIVAVIDLDDFKRLNDQFGHDVGDAVLIEVANRMVQNVSPSTSIYRIGGDEFAAICTADGACLQDLARQLSSSSEKAFETPGGIIPFNLSIGVSSAQTEAIDIRNLYSEADIALFEAKGETGTSACHYNDQLGARKQRRVHLSGRLAEAIARGNIDVAFQPQIDIIQNCIIGFEALARWNDPVLGAVSPVEFVPIAEESELVNDLDRAIFCKALQLTQDWLAQDQRIAINISGRTLLSPGFVNFVRQTIDETQLKSTQIQIEITETELILDKELARQVTTQIGNLGLSIALDDFGTGYSSLSYLSSLPIHALKIDRSFVQARNCLSNVTIMKSIIGLAASLELDLLVEGVEHVEQLDLIRELGCSKVQGYYFSRPLTLEQCLEFQTTYPARTRLGMKLEQRLLEDIAS